MPARITGNASPQEVWGFVDHLLGLRFRGLKEAPLDSCEITFDDDEFADKDMHPVNRWIRRVVECCQGKALLIDMGKYLGISDEHLFSHHLTRVELAGISFNNGFLYFSSCPELQDLHLICQCTSWRIGRSASQSLFTG
ncbi:hypothetical protein ACP70R_033760 [Stipagrostis hirtigluma subsp. patula]